MKKRKDGTALKPQNVEMTGRPSHKPRARGRGEHVIHLKLGNDSPLSSEESSGSSDRGKIRQEGIPAVNEKAVSMKGTLFGEMLRDMADSTHCGALPTVA